MLVQTSFFKTWFLIRYILFKSHSSCNNYNYKNNNIVLCAKKQPWRDSNGNCIILDKKAEQVKITVVPRPGSANRRNTPSRKSSCLFWDHFQGSFCMVNTSWGYHIGGAQVEALLGITDVLMEVFCLQAAGWS